MTLELSSHLSPSPEGYAQALAWLFCQGRGGRQRDPERTRALIRALGLAMPPKSVHVVGTNGKGTVTAMLAGAYGACGRRTGMFISPHVEEFRERISVNGEQIAKHEVTAFIAWVSCQAITPEPAFFELTFAMALEHFARHHVEIAVVEAGVGARRDATITLEGVQSTVITSISRDHLDVLGPTLQDIASDKAEAVRPGVPVITAEQGETLETIAQIAASRHSPMFVDTPSSPLFRLPPELDGLQARDSARWQNARLVAAALRVAGDVPEEAIRQGLLTPKLPARAEVFTVHGRTVILDGAHNPGAARALRAMLDTPFVLLFGALPKKLGEETLAELEPYASHVFIAPVDDQGSALERREGRSFKHAPVNALIEAVETAPEGTPVVIAGSLYLAGTLRPYLRAHQGSPLAVSTPRATSGT
jgi:dihydrofolate synthase/folylpolyglutamate synthase